LVVAVGGRLAAGSDARYQGGDIRKYDGQDHTGDYGALDGFQWIHCTPLLPDRPAISLSNNGYCDLIVSYRL
jgi:hypothetical protein